MEGIDWVVGGVLGFTGFALYTGSRALYSCAREIESAEHVTPGPKLLKRAQEGDGLDYVAVSGYVHPRGESPTTLGYGSSQSPCVVRVTKTKEHAKEYSRTSKSWRDSTKTVGRTFQAIPFMLTSSTDRSSARDDPRDSVAVHAFDGDFGDVLTKVESSFDSVNANVSQSILGFVSGHQVTGYESVEEVLPIAQFVTVLGKVFFVGGSLVVESPSRHRFILTAEPLKAVARRYHRRAAVARFFARLCVAGLASYGCYRAWKLFKKWRQARDSRAVLAELQETDGGSDADAANDSTAMCCVCMEKRSSVLLMDCRHLCVCPECSVRVDDCPICRGLITERVRVYQ